MLRRCESAESRDFRMYVIQFSHSFRILGPRTRPWAPTRRQEPCSFWFHIPGHILLNRFFCLHVDHWYGGPVRSAIFESPPISSTSSGLELLPLPSPHLADAHSNLLQSCHQASTCRPGVCYLPLGAAAPVLGSQQILWLCVLGYMKFKKILKINTNLWTWMTIQCKRCKMMRNEWKLWQCIKVNENRWTSITMVECQWPNNGNP